MSWFSRDLMQLCARRTDVFVETGTHKGNTSAMAAEFFREVHTIELDDFLFAQAVKRFAEVPRVKVWHGNSAYALTGIMLTLPSKRCTFWLDAHPMGGANTDGTNPIELELEAIGRYSTGPDIILIDDLPEFESGAPGYPSVQQLRELIWAIDPAYIIDRLPMPRWKMPVGTLTVMSASRTAITIDRKKMAEEPHE